MNNYYIIRNTETRQIALYADDLRSARTYARELNTRYQTNAYQVETVSAEA